MNSILEHCRTIGGWCTPGVILTADELKGIFDKECECHDKRGVGDEEL